MLWLGCRLCREWNFHAPVLTETLCASLGVDIAVSDFGYSSYILPFKVNTPYIPLHWLHWRGKFQVAWTLSKFSERGSIPCLLIVFPQNSILSRSNAHSFDDWFRPASSMPRNTSSNVLSNSSAVRVALPISSISGHFCLLSLQGQVLLGQNCWMMIAS